MNLNAILLPWRTALINVVAMVLLFAAYLVALNFPETSSMFPYLVGGMSALGLGQAGKSAVEKLAARGPEVKS